MQINDSKFIEHQPFTNTWNSDVGDKVTFLVSVPDDWVVHAGLYLFIKMKIANIFQETHNTLTGNQEHYENAENINQDEETYFNEIAGLQFNKIISEVMIRLNKQGVQQYRSRDFLTEYLSTIIEDNIVHANDDYKWYKGYLVPTRAITMKSSSYELQIGN